MSSVSTKKIGILQTGIMGGELADQHGEYPDMFKDMLGKNNFHYRIYPVLQGVFPDDPAECDGWIITGSKHGVYENHDWIKPLEKFTRQLFESKVPTLGICFGHQLMAQAMGGTVEKHPHGWAIGLQEYTDKNTGERVKLRAFHQDQVVELPPKVEITHTSDFCKYAGLKYSPTFVSLQPHPEHTSEFAKDLIEVRLANQQQSSLVKNALSTLHEDDHHETVIGDISKFFTSQI